MHTLSSTLMSSNVKNILTVTSLLKKNTATPESTTKLEELETKFTQILDEINDYNSQTQKNIQQIKESGMSLRNANKQIRDIESIWKGLPPDDFTRIPIVPKVQELIEDGQPFLRPNLIQGAYPNAEVYLDVQFHLLREDFMSPLRKGVKEYLDHKINFTKLSSKNSVKVYKNVTILPTLNLYTRTPSYTVKLDFDNRGLRRIKWDKSKRLLNGSLLVFTNDNLQTAYFGTVARRDVQELTNELTFSICWESGKPKFQQSNGDNRRGFMGEGLRFDMLECDIFFESYRYTLAALQNLNLENFPLRPYLISGLSEKKVPNYILDYENPVSFQILMGNNEEEESTDLTCDFSWPSAEAIGMDDSQYAAFKGALTHQISVIQGPPGTGKTWIGIQIAKIILENPELFFNKTSLDFGPEDQRPILIVCYTNHALDQFLEAILHVMHSLHKYTDGSLIRIGGNSKSDDMMDLLLHKQFDRAKSKKILPRYLSDTFNRYHYHLRDLKSSRMHVMQFIKHLKEPNGIIDLRMMFKEWDPKGFISFKTLSDAEKDLIRTLFSMESVYVIKAFGLHSSQFGRQFLHSKFDVNEDKLIKIFAPKRKVEPKPKLHIQQGEGSNVNDDPDEVDSDNEDYDLNELMADRLLEIEQEVEENQQLNSKFEFYQLEESTFQHNYYQICSTIKSCEKILNDPGSTPEDKKFANEQLYDRDLYQLEQRELQNYPKQMKILHRILDLYKKNQLDISPINSSIMLTLSEKLRQRSFDITTSHLLWSFYFSIIEKLKPLILPKVFKLEEEILETSVQYEESRNACEGYLCSNAKFVGMTTTGAAKYNSLLKMMGSRMVIVEEAAEVLESHIVTSITEHCEHLILIGDHKQLRPKNCSYELTKKFNFDVSLFERLINNNLQCYTLEIQHRMRPEIADLLVPTIYEKLINHESVLYYPKVAGVETDLFFINHKELEKEDEDVSSHVNEHEARFIIALCKHFLLNGYSKDQITILTTYIGQVFLLKKMIRKEPDFCQGVRVTAVDNFQGEENDIILLSLVRSNERNKVGFVKIDNRICVSLSRAKHGMFVVGNMDCVVSASEKWAEIVDKLKTRPGISGIGTHLKLKCTLHGNITPVATKEDFTLSPCGGCNQICNTKLQFCTHFCPQVCHGTDTNHSKYKCKEKCESKCEKHGHPCTSICSKPCPQCEVKVETTLKCDHTHSIKCYEDPEEYNCPTEVIRTLSCGHSLEMKCYENPSSKKCQVIVSRTLELCGHTHQLPCSLSTFDCPEQVVVKIPICGHELQLNCFESFKPSDNWVCKSKCDTRLVNCGHSCTKKCHILEDPSHEKYKCNKECSKRCPNGHKCGAELEHNHKCHSKCPNCELLVTKTLPLCKHSVEIECFKSLDSKYMESYKCKEKVLKMSPCGHEILLACWDTPERSKCKTLVLPSSNVKSSCGHGVYVPCTIQSTATPEQCSKYCDQPCGMKLKVGDIGCDHECKAGSCSACHQGRFHVKCSEECGRVLVCGHVCKEPCSELCPPCEAKCDMKCQHSKCKLKCGVPCIPCNEPCTRRCEHLICTKLCGEECNVPVCNVPCQKQLKCGHPCIGFCSEMCPVLCRICNKDEVTSIFFGNENDENARFVQLEDCNHVFEVEGLNTWMETKQDGEENRIFTIECPQCKTIIRNSQRYKSILTSAINNVLKVKEKLYGNQELLITEQIKLSKKLVNLYNSSDTTLKDLNSVILYLSKQIFIESLNPLIHQKDSNIRNRRPKQLNFEAPEAYKMKRINQYELETLSNIVQWLEDTKNIFLYSTKHLTTSKTRSITKKYIELFYMLTSFKEFMKLTLSPFQIHQAKMEFQRLNDYFEIQRRLNYIQKDLASESTLTRKAIMLELKILNTKTTYGNDVRNGILKELEILDKLLKESFNPVYVPDPSIFQAMSHTREAWYICPNGHLYTIGNCGMASQRSTCPDCGMGIGSSGIEHVNAENNVRVTHGVGEMPSREIVGVRRETPDFF